MVQPNGDWRILFGPWFFESDVLELIRKVEHAVRIPKLRLLLDIQERRDSAVSRRRIAKVNSGLNGHLVL